MLAVTHRPALSEGDPYRILLAALVEALRCLACICAQQCAAAVAGTVAYAWSHFCPVCCALHWSSSVQLVCQNERKVGGGGTTPATRLVLLCWVCCMCALCQYKHARLCSRTCVSFAWYAWCAAAAVACKACVCACVRFAVLRRTRHFQARVFTALRKGSVQNPTLLCAWQGPAIGTHTPAHAPLRWTCSEHFHHPEAGSAQHHRMLHTAMHTLGLLHWQSVAWCTTPCGATISFLHCCWRCTNGGRGSLGCACRCAPCTLLAPLAVRNALDLCVACLSLRVISNVL